jgi:hypothetical protein
MNSDDEESKPQSIDECLLTFEDWPEDAMITAKALAETGFYYLGNELRVKCYMCGLEVDDWNSGMTALGTHARRRYSCPIIQAIYSTKTGDIQCVNEKWRLQTLQDLSFGQLNKNDDDQRQTDEQVCQELAACGFYRFKDTAHIRCAYCGIIINPKLESSIMSQHRSLAKQSKKSCAIDCLMVRAQCPTNIVIPDRKRFPEHPRCEKVYDRIMSFQSYKDQHNIDEKFIRERADAGFFLHSKNLSSYHFLYRHISYSTKTYAMFSVWKFLTNQ